MKILLSVFLPATGNSYDIWTPKDIMVYEATALIAQILAEKEPRYFQPTNTIALYDGVSGNELRADAFVGALGLHNGAGLILV
ncbi:MAG: hypothetical protein LBP28_09040 [Coriobacteriales bacterium]|jgi:hypothetical protein|nr:hypothetical protein [Coriobacteriales bacterium]